MSTPKSKSRAKWWQVAVLIPLVPLLVAFVLLWLVFFVVSTIFLHIAIWSWWCIRGRDILFVYSDSPIWHDYIERHILPYLGRARCGSELVGAHSVACLAGSDRVLPIRRVASV
jgi:hypothetical protein